MHIHDESAYPTTAANHAPDYCSPGMSLRDAFAISALPMCMTAEVDVDTAALMAYGMAEAMLRARNATQGEPDAS